MKRGWAGPQQGTALWGGGEKGRREMTGKRRGRSGRQGRRGGKGGEVVLSHRTGAVCLTELRMYVKNTRVLVLRLSWGSTLQVCTHPNTHVHPWQEWVAWGGCRGRNTQHWGRGPLLFFAITTLWIHIFQQVAHANCSDLQNQSSALGKWDCGRPVNKEVAAVKQPPQPAFPSQCLRNYRRWLYSLQVITLIWKQVLTGTLLLMEVTLGGF